MERERKTAKNNDFAVKNDGYATDLNEICGICRKKQGVSQAFERKKNVFFDHVYFMP